MSPSVPIGDVRSLSSGTLINSTKKATKLIRNFTLKRDVHLADKIFFLGLLFTSFLTVILLASIGLFLYLASEKAIAASGWQIIFRSLWDPVRDVYGVLPVLYGTLVSSLLGVIFAVPLSLGIALFTNELAPKKLATIVGFLVELLAAIPSVVYGLWGIFVLVPLLRGSIQPFLIENLGFLPIFTGPAYGVGMFTSGLILALMITPTISSISREVFRAIPHSQREAALALGATRWEMMRLSVLKSAKAGVFGAIILGLGRALGETMAVTMVIGNRAEIVASLFAPAQTMASVIANEYTEATSEIHLSTLAFVGLLLFMVTFLVNSIAHLIISKITKKHTGTF